MWSLLASLVSCLSKSARPMSTVLLAVAFTPAMASTYYVSTTGSDQTGNGSAFAPWRSVFKATSAVVSAGAVIHVGAGLFEESDRLSLAAGVSLEGAGQGSTTLKPSALFKQRYPTTGGSSTLLTIGAYNSTIIDGNQSVSMLTIDGDGHTLNLCIDLNSRNNVALHDINVKDCFYSALNLNGRISGTASWPTTPDGSANLPADTDYISNIQIYDSTFSNSGYSPSTSTNWAYGTINISGIRDSRITRVLLDESAYGGFNLKGTWAKNFEVSACDCRQKSVSLWGGKGTAIEIGNVINGDFFEIKTNGGLSIQADKTRIHHNRIVMPSAEAQNVFLVEFSGFRSSIDGNYFEGGYAVILGGLGDTVSIHDNVFRGSSGALLINAETLPTAIRSVNFDNNTLDGVQDLYGGGAVDVRVQDPNSYVSGVNIRNNIVANGLGRGVTLSGQNGNPNYSPNISNATIANNVFYNNAGGDIYTTNAVGTVVQNNRQGTDLAFVGTLPLPSPYYELGSASPALQAGNYIGLPFLGDGPPNAGSYVAPAGLFEAEMNYSIKADTGTTPISVGYLPLATGKHAIAVLDAGDAIRIHFSVPATGQYVLKARLRSGDSSNDHGYFSGGYAFKLDGIVTSLVGNQSSISYDPAGGGIYWGEMVSAATTLKAGLHHLEVAAQIPWAFVDSLTVTPNH